MMTIDLAEIGAAARDLADTAALRGQPFLSYLLLMAAEEAETAKPNDAVRRTDQVRLPADSAENGAAHHPG